ncbi:hypothetical protein OBBRIDRAFT_807918 [Obba rivulosa]|uniref:Uncharacterized protein n=1 Tax=Obba rivulosa TaxID=1052685 RepID=A0A8E2AI32_9APHY|nr:hypothetical protein OBBRIDRAFT_807918 [Obba rivulosa]
MRNLVVADAALKTKNSVKDVQVTQPTSPPALPLMPTLYCKSTAKLDECLMPLKAMLVPSAMSNSRAQTVLPALGLPESLSLTHDRLRPFGPHTILALCQYKISSHHHRDLLQMKSFYLQNEWVNQIQSRLRVSAEVVMNVIAAIDADSLAAQEKAALLDKDIRKWYETTVEFLQKLSTKFGKKLELYLHIMFFGAACIKDEHKANAFNMWGYKLAKAAIKYNDSIPLCLLSLENKNLEDYHSLTEEQKKELVCTFKEKWTTHKFGTHTTQHGRSGDIVTVCMKVDGLHRVGVKYFFALSVTPTLVLYKAEIRLAKGENPEQGEHTARMADIIMPLPLVDITGNEKMVINYLNHEHDIVLCYSVKLCGWTHEKFINLFELSTSLPPLQKLLNALDTGSCHFVKLTSAELEQHKKAYYIAIEDGTI